jgi:Mg2+ and Co2+ transporter CorA
VSVFAGAFGRSKQSRSNGRRRGSIVAQAKLEEALPEDVEKVSLSYAIIAKFFGEDPYREIHRHLEGYEQMEIKGLVYWKERLKKYSLKVESLKALISTQLDEKRNFMSFMLTIITTVLAPLAILTGYFGMNFTNMKELEEDTYKATPGVTLMWVISGFSYGILLIFALHFRVLYAAT